MLKDLIEKIDRNRLPQHIAIIMDGNGRWAKKRGLPRTFGHRAGIKSVRAVIECCREIGVKCLTLYAFSAENWQRPRTEIFFLMSLLSEYLKKELKELQENNIHLITSGDVSGLPEKIQKQIEEVSCLTGANSKMTLNLALNYGSKQEIVNAIKGLVKSKKEITEKNLSQFLYTKDLPDPDLLIRTSGELRISNFMLWQIAYSELYFTPVLWPDFSKDELCKAIIDYQKRERRFGAL